MTTSQLTQDGLGEMLILPRVKACHTHHFRESHAYLSVIVKGHGYCIRLQTEHQPTDAKDAGVWYGSETRTDTDGTEWSCSLGNHVIDNFGNLVPVAA